VKAMKILRAWYRWRSNVRYWRTQNRYRPSPQTILPFDDEAKGAHAAIDGARLVNCITLDPINGIAWCYRMNENGHPFAERGEVAREVWCGNVTLERAA
jgi:hypothetical protein